MKLTACTGRPVSEPCSLEGRAYQVEPYIGCAHYCYYCYALNQAETDWSEEIFYHDNLIGRLKTELSGISPQSIYMGWQTDPYQPCEAEHQQTRGVLKLLLERNFSASILTKSNLILRDMDLLGSMDNASASMSVAFTDDTVRQLFEANTMDTQDRIDALAEMNSKGIHTNALLCPVIPYITDAAALVKMLAPYVDKIWIYGLSILDRMEKSWRNVEKILDQNFPGLKDKIDAAVFSKEDAYWYKTRQELESLAKQKKLNLSIHF